MYIRFDNKRPMNERASPFPHIPNRRKTGNSFQNFDKEFGCRCLLSTRYARGGRVACPVARRETRASSSTSSAFPIFSRLTPNEARQRQFRSIEGSPFILFYFIFFFSDPSCYIHKVAGCHLKSPFAHSRSLLIPSTSYF